MGYEEIPNDFEENEELDQLLDNLKEHKSNINPGFPLESKYIAIISVALVVFSLIVYSAIPPGTIGLVDKMKDTDNDGLNDFEELALNLDPSDKDTDGDGIDDFSDSCPNSISGVTEDTNQDGCYDAESDDDDGDGIIDSNDNCPTGVSNWKSSAELDFDSDGCHDEAEDYDDDSDGMNDTLDECENTPLNSEDFDTDGCADFEDPDIDNDGFSNEFDLCNFSLVLSQLVDSENDYDQDGCDDLSEDNDIDGDGVIGLNDSCEKSPIGWKSDNNSDIDMDGCKDDLEDDDDDGDGYEDDLDPCPTGNFSAPDHDMDGCEDSLDLDDDGDGLSDELDACPRGELNWTNIWWNPSDVDNDGCKNDSEDEDNDNDGILNENDACKNGRVGWESNQSSDYDSDGCRDYDEDSDDDNDGVLDFLDFFPLDSDESSDNDLDGVGDNQDTDDDNDGCIDEFDSNSNVDIGLKIDINKFQFTDQVDQTNVVGEIFFVISVDENRVGYFEPKDIILNQEHVLSHSITIDLEDSEDYICQESANKRYHWIGIEAWDHDPTESDLLDINPSPLHRSLYFIYDAQLNQITDFENYTSPRGVSDGSTDTSDPGADDDDGKIWFDWELVDIRKLSQSDWEWDYGGYSHTLSNNLSYSDYVEAREFNHDRNFSGESDVLKFITPDSDSILEISNHLLFISNNFGYDDVQFSNFVLEFVKSVDSMYENEADGFGNDPKYPVEMLWEGTGNSENSVYLYNSIMESLGYETITVYANVKTISNDGDLGKYVFSGINLENLTGDYIALNNTNGENINFYYAHSNGGNTVVGQKRWFEIETIYVYY